MIYDRHGIGYPTVFDAIAAMRERDARYESTECDTLNRIDLRNLRACLDAIIRSARADGHKMNPLEWVLPERAKTAAAEAALVAEPVP